MNTMILCCFRVAFWLSLLIPGFIDYPEINRGSLLIPIGINRDPSLSLYICVYLRWQGERMRAGNYKIIIEIFLRYAIHLHHHNDHHHKHNHHHFNHHRRHRDPVGMRLRIIVLGTIIMTIIIIVTSMMMMTIIIMVI